MTRKILIVDDSPVMRKLVQRVVELSGFTAGNCFSAGNGIEALELLARQPVDLILSDINMPIMDGEELLRALGADPKLAAIPFLVLSTDATSRRMRDMFALGAAGYLSKPFTPEALQAELQRVAGALHA